MSTLAELEEAVAQLPAEQFLQLLQRMKLRDAERWDHDMEEDAKSGRLDEFFLRLEEENAAESEVPLHDFLDQGKLPKAV